MVYVIIEGGHASGKLCKNILCKIENSQGSIRKFQDGVRVARFGKAVLWQGKCRVGSGNAELCHSYIKQLLCIVCDIIGVADTGVVFL